MSTILVLGGGGFLASHVEQRYARRGWRVVSIGRSATDGAQAAGNYIRHAWNLPHPELAHLLAIEQPEICVNAAGKASVPASMVEPFADFQASTQLNYLMLEAVRARSPKTVYIYLSSAAVYGDPSALPIGEDTAVAPISPYGLHKRLSEMILEQQAKLFGTRAASLRIFSSYGERLHRQVVWDLACRVVNSDTASLVLKGCPADSRDFIHGDDVAAAVEAVAARGSLVGEVYNVASGVETPVREIAALIVAALGCAPDIVFDETRHPGVPGRWHANIDRLRGLGFEPSVDLADGVTRVAKEARRTCAAEGAM